MTRRKGRLPSFRLELSLSLSPAWTWLVVFAPALSYLVRTRLQSYTAWAGNVGQPLPDARLVLAHLDLDSSATAGSNPHEAKTEVDPLACRELSKSFYLSFDPATKCPTEFPIHDAAMVISKGLRSVTDSVWRHDSGLGRGYVLVSDSHGNGRVWRWEVGGGPIAIGRTLQLERSGCRSNVHRRCRQDSNDDVALSRETTAINASRPSQLLGSGGMTVDFLGKDHFDEGQLVLAEWGEGRIVRLEDESGARTPLVLTVPNLCHNGDEGNTSDGGSATVPSNPATIRVQQPTRMLYTQRGDLLFVDHHSACDRSGLFLLKAATKVEPLTSLPESRAAHAWTDLPTSRNSTPERVNLTTSVNDLNGDPMSEGVKWIGGVALAPGPSETGTLYLVAQLDVSRRVVLLRHDLYGNDEDPEESPERSDSTVVVADLTPYARGGGEDDGNLGSISVSQDFVFVAMGNQVLVIQSSTYGVLGRIELAADTALPSFTSITLGGDGYLYLTTQDQLIRIRVKQGPIKHPTNLVPKSAVRTSTS